MFHKNLLGQEYSQPSFDNSQFLGNFYVGDWASIMSVFTSRWQLSFSLELPYPYRQSAWAPCGVSCTTPSISELILERD